MAEGWSDMAQMALDAGHDAREVATAAFEQWSGGKAIQGFGSERWSPWVKAFASLLEEAEGPLQEVAAHGLAVAQGRLSESEKWKRRFELTGVF